MLRVRSQPPGKIHHKRISELRRQRRLIVETLESRRLLAEISVTGSTVDESSGDVDFTLELAQPAVTAVQAFFSTQDGRAAANIDYEPIRRREINFGPGETTKTVTVNVRDNLLRDGDRSFSGNVTTTDETGNARIARITDDENKFDAFSITPDGKTVVCSTFDRMLYSVPVDGSAPPIKLSDGQPIVAGSNPLQFFTITPDSKHVVFIADLAEAGNQQLYSVPINGSSDPIRLSGPPESGSLDNDVNFRITPDSQTVVYPFQSPITGLHEAFSVPVDGSADPTPLHSGPIIQLSLGMAGDGSSVVYQSSDADLNLFRVPLDGLTPPIALTDDVRVFRFSIPGYRLSPDGMTALFLRAESLPGDSGLFSVPVDGSTEPVRIALTSSTSVRHQITADSQTVVFRVESSPTELFAVPLDGSADPKLLNPAGSGQDVQKYQISDDGNLILYESRQPTFNQTELYAVPTDGSSTPTRLTNANEIGRVSWSKLSPDHTRAVFSTSQTSEGNSVTKLYSVLTDGSAAPVEISGPLVAGGNVQISFSQPHISSDSTTVTYLAHQDTHRPLELYNVPIDGSATAVKVNAPLPENGSVVLLQSLAVSAQGIVYMVNEGTPGSSATPVNIYSRTNTLFSSGTATIRDDDLLVADFGDAPSAEQSGFRQDYPVRIDQDGARHTVGELFFGSNVDIESDGQPDNRAGQDGTGGDDVNEREPVSAAGVTTIADIVMSISVATSSVNVTASGSGQVDAWIDFNRDGEWSDPGEQIFDRVAVVSGGDNILPFSVPVGAAGGQTGARFRLSTVGGLAPTGVAADGEVEDYWLTIDAGTNAHVNLVHELSQVLIEDRQIVVRGSNVDIFAVRTSTLRQLNLTGFQSNNTIEASADVSPLVRLNVDGGGGDNKLQLINPGQVASNGAGFDFTTGGNIVATNIHKKLNMTAPVRLN